MSDLERELPADWTFTLADIESIGQQTRLQPFSFGVKTDFDHFCQSFHLSRFSGLDMDVAYDAFCRGWEKGRTLWP